LLFAPFNKTKKKQKGKPSFAKDEDIRTEAWDTPMVRAFRVENTSGFVKDGRAAPLKYRDMEI
jgi:hypothetical protein